MMIYDVFQQALRRPPRKPTKDLYVSDLGVHPYKAMARILKNESPEFSQSTLEKMQCGVALEEDTVKLLGSQLPIMTQFPLWNRMWSGYADMVIGHGTTDVTIVEHKATDSKAFSYVPKSTHACQLWLYGELYYEMYSIVPQLILVYRSWGKWAEYGITVEDGYVLCRGSKWDGGAGSDDIQRLMITPDGLRDELEGYYMRQELPNPAGSDSWTYPEDSHARLWAPLTATLTPEPPLQEEEDIPF